MWDAQLLMPNVSSTRPSYVNIVSIGVTQSVLRSMKTAASMLGESSRSASFGSASVSRRTLTWSTRRYEGRRGSAVSAQDESSAPRWLRPHLRDVALADQPRDRAKRPLEVMHRLRRVVDRRLVAVLQHAGWYVGSADVVAR